MSRKLTPYFSFMTTKHQVCYATIKYNEKGTPCSAEFDDVYFSNKDGLAESQYVFLQQNDITRRFSELPQHGSFSIAETGFGTGLNFFATWLTWQDAIQTTENNFTPKSIDQTQPRLRFYSFEKFPLNYDDMIVALAQWPNLKALTDEFLLQYPKSIEGNVTMLLAGGTIELTLLIGDVNQTISQLTTTTAANQTVAHQGDASKVQKLPSIQAVDAWYLDGFAPSKNPDMWTPNLFQNMARLSNERATLASFTAAGFVRRGLIEQGFKMKKVKGFGYKRDMIAGHLERATR